VGPQAARFVLVSHRNYLSWRPEGDPVVDLLRQGLLVTDGDLHANLRDAMKPALHRRLLETYTPAILQRTDQVTEFWFNTDRRGKPLDMLVEMRRVALLILMDTMYSVDFSSEISRLWQSILSLLDYISPGPWILWSGIPRPGYRRARLQMDAYLYELISLRRKDLQRKTSDDRLNLLDLLISNPYFDDDIIRDQLLTMLIAGHDTSTAMLAWALHLLSQHPTVMKNLQGEVDSVLGKETPGFQHLKELCYLDQVLRETLRLYPPIHIGNRIATCDLDFEGYQIPKGTRVMYSIYLTQRHPDYWKDPDHFDPERFAPGWELNLTPYTYIPFGGGPRNCIGMAFAQVEAKIILARLIQQFDFQPTGTRVHAHMGATLEPRPGVNLYVKPR